MVCKFILELSDFSFLLSKRMICLDLLSFRLVLLVRANSAYKEASADLLQQFIDESVIHRTTYIELIFKFICLFQFLVCCIPRTVYLFNSLKNVSLVLAILKSGSVLLFPTHDLCLCCFDLRLSFP